MQWLVVSSKVLNSLKGIHAEAPPPFAQSAQYQKAFKDTKESVEDPKGGKIKAKKGFEEEEKSRFEETTGYI